MTMQRVQALPAMAKAGLVLGGYVAAALLAFGAVVVHVGLTGERDDSAMYAFGDLLLFVAVFGMASIVPTGLALVFLRRSRGFWIALCVVALAVAATAFAEVALTMAASQHPWAMLAFPRIFLSPFLAAAFFLAAWVAPERGFRGCLLAAAGIEGASALYGFFHWFVPLLAR